MSTVLRELFQNACMTRKRLRCKLEIQEALARAAKGKSSRLEKKGIEAEGKTSIKAFTVGFNKCKLMIQSRFPDVDIESLHANLSDKSLIAAMGDGARLIMETSKKYTDIIPPTNINQDAEDDDGIEILLHITDSPPKASAGPSRVPRLK